MAQHQQPGTLQRALFGGAITAVLPARLQDISEVRQVPDSQEVRCCPYAC